MLRCALRSRKCANLRGDQFCFGKSCSSGTKPSQACLTRCIGQGRRPSTPRSFVPMPLLTTARQRTRDTMSRMWREITAAVAAAAVVGGGRSRSSLLMGDAAGERATTQPDPRRGQLFVAGGCGGLSAVCGGSLLILCALSQSATELPVFDAAGSGVNSPLLLIYTTNRPKVDFVPRPPVALSSSRQSVKCCEWWTSVVSRARSKAAKLGRCAQEGSVISHASV